MACAPPDPGLACRSRHRDRHPGREPRQQIDPRTADVRSVAALTLLLSVASGTPALAELHDAWEIETRCTERLERGVPIRDQLTEIVALRREQPAQLAPAAASSTMVWPMFLPR